MNILLFLPGLLVLLFQYRGIVGTLEGIATIALIQVSFELDIAVSQLTPAAARSAAAILPLRVSSAPGKSLLYIGLRPVPTVPIRMDCKLALYS